MPHFISLAILVGVIVLMGFAPSPTPKTTLPTQETSLDSTFTAIPTQTDTKQESKPSTSSGGAKPTGNSVTPTTVILQTESAELKIAKCKAEEESSYISSIQKINQTTDARLKEIFALLQKQYQDGVNNLYNIRDEQITRVKNDSSLTGTQRLSLIEQYSDSASEQADTLYKNQQTFWENQKKQIEDVKQSSIDKINVLISEQYNNCLGN